VNVLEPGVGLNLSNVDLTSGSEVVAKLKVFLSKILLNILFKEYFEALATNEILQIVVFSIFFGLAAASIEIMLNLWSLLWIKCRILF
jgi:Na+/H+-dicarboxylate symporter